MTVTTDAHPAGDVAPASPPGRPRWLVATLVGIVAVAVVAASFALGTVTGGRDTASEVPVPSDGSVDVGFARDMITHHQQAIEMAGVTRDGSTNPKVKLLAFDIETGQLAQVGQMQGWLQVWGKNPNNPGEPMSWMPASEHAGHSGHADADGLMPGMATPEEVDRLRSARGNDLDVLFLQLMIRHHQGGIPMAEYAAEHAAQPVVRDLADKMVKAQSAEVISMEKLLRELGGTPLPPP
jgi:uncharacterized protein (DUF305 family)